MLRLGCCFPQP